MTKHDHHANGSKHEHKSNKRGVHKDWRTWTAVTLMIVAMAAYVLSFDESLQPGGEIAQSMPVADQAAGE